MTIPRVLIVAGSDSGGGAGIQADIKTVTMLGGHAMTAITAITAQNSLGVTKVMPVPAAMVLAQIDAVLGDLGADAIKIGMIGSAEVAEVLAERLTVAPPRRRGSSSTVGTGPPPSRGNITVPIVFDPVMVATSGAMLADAPTIAAFARLMDIAAMVTPNAPELAALSGLPVGTIEQAETAAIMLHERHGCAVLAKGGHIAAEIDGAPVVRDLLVSAEGVRAWSGGRIETRHSHGTGCTLASGIAAGLAAGMALAPAIERARSYLRAALLAAPGLGAGHGPMGHALGGVPFDAMGPSVQGGAN